MTTEEKAKRFDEALEQIKGLIEGTREDKCAIVEEDIIGIFPELKESEEEWIEKIRKDIISYLNNRQITSIAESSATERWIVWLEKQNTVKFNDEKDEKIRKELLETFKYQQRESRTDKEWLNGTKLSDVVAWLEKQGENHLVNFDEAEKEKYDFVSGQYIECRASFNEFKEDNSYWLEYIGDDTYIGRSDNILNQKFHITPRQLYRLFTQQHSPKEDNTNEETNTPTEYGKYVDECLNEAYKHFFSEGEDTYSVADLFYAGVRCGKSWLEKQGEQKTTDKVEPKFKVGDTMRTLQEADDGYTDGMPVVVSIDNEYYHCTNELIAIKDQDDYEFPPINVKKKPVDKIQPKFHEGDWVVNNTTLNLCQILKVEHGQYICSDCSFPITKENNYHLWTIQDAEEGDVLAVDSMPFIYNGSKNEVTVGTYCGFNAKHLFSFAYNYVINQNITPATKEQRGLLFEKMNEAGYEWDEGKKELMKIEK